MSNKTHEGLEELIEELQGYIEKAEKPEDIVEEGVKEFVLDLRKLPKPISTIKKAGYTHLIKTFAYRKKGKEFEVGWGKYYGPMIEYGTKNMKAIAHLRPCFERNKNKYYSTMYRKVIG